MMLSTRLKRVLGSILLVGCWAMPAWAVDLNAEQAAEIQTAEVELHALQNAESGHLMAVLMDHGNALLDEAGCLQAHFDDGTDWNSCDD